MDISHGDRSLVRFMSRTVARKSTIEGFYVRAGGTRLCMGTWHSNLTKIPLIYSVSCFDLGRLGALFGGLSPPKLLVATGLFMRSPSPSHSQSASRHRRCRVETESSRNLSPAMSRLFNFSVESFRSITFWAAERNIKAAGWNVNVMKMFCKISWLKYWRFFWKFLKNLSLQNKVNSKKSSA